MTENQQAWLAALRSGQFAQCRGKLTRLDGDSMSCCCLGVACEVALSSGVPLVVKPGGIGDYHWRLYDSNHNWLPQAVVEWLDMKLADGRFIVTDEMDLPDSCVSVMESFNESEGAPVDARCCSLPSLNDTAGWSFAQIADFIERFPQSFFN